MVPDALRVDAGAVGEQGSVGGAEGVSEATVGLADIGAGKETGLGQIAGGDVAVMEPEAGVQVRVTCALEPALPA